MTFLRAATTGRRQRTGIVCVSFRGEMARVPTRSITGGKMSHAGVTVRRPPRTDLDVNETLKNRNGHGREARTGRLESDAVLTVDPPRSGLGLPTVARRPCDRACSRAAPYYSEHARPGRTDVESMACKTITDDRPPRDVWNSSRTVVRHCSGSKDDVTYDLFAFKSTSRTYSPCRVSCLATARAICYYVRAYTRVCLRVRETGVYADKCFTRPTWIFLSISYCSGSQIFFPRCSFLD